MATIQKRVGKRGTTYRVESMREGRRNSKSFKTRQEAVKYNAHLETNSELQNIVFNSSAHSKTLAEVARECISNDTGKDPSKAQRIKYWIDVLGQKKLGKVSTDDVRKQLRTLQKDKSHATVNRYKAALSAVYKYAQEELGCKYSPLKGIKQLKEDNARTRFLSSDEISRLLKACESTGWPLLRLLVQMAIVTGARRSELINLKWGDVDLKKKTALLRTSKNGNPRTLTFTDSVRDELMSFRAVDGYIFTSPKQKSYPLKHFDFYWRKALKTAAINNFRFHDLRHTCASVLSMNGASVLEVADVLGHKSLTMTQRYAHLCTDHKKELTQKVFGGI